ncbi:DUF1254 domain-containing protein [Novosphingobium huizhouense]|uniref:DUF1254 domain-containing protein n=1 Tax=Novosphingobium huizhouense TaxID=2866625 RepID=UPI001CD82D3E|nr:DUF1254 domain-containing protein [Novosphingobium huizhouense]
MRRPVLLLAAFAVTALLVHLGAIVAAPRVIMALAIGKLGQGGAAVNRFQFSRRTNAQSRDVVRPSPDLAYASCVYDLEKGPLLVEAAPTPGGGYASVSVFAGNTDNIGVFDTIANPQGVRFALVRAGEPFPDKAVRLQLPLVVSPSRKGVILDRRLAPTQAAFDLADKARRADRCAPL